MTVSEANTCYTNYQLLNIRRVESHCRTVGTQSILPSSYYAHTLAPIRLSLLESFSRFSSIL